MAVSHSVVLYEPTETSAEVVTAAGFLAGYSGRTRDAYTLDLRQFIRWCDEHRLALFDVTRTQIELYAREPEELGRAPATIGRRLSTLWRVLSLRHRGRRHLTVPGRARATTQARLRVPRRRS